MLSEKEISVLKIFLNTDEFITGKEIASQTGFSERSIRTYIKTINNILEPKKAEILTKKGVGYKLKCADINEVNYLISYSSQNDRIYRLLHMIFLERKRLLTYDICDKLSISSHTLKNDLTKIKKMLLSFNIKLKSDLSISGNEDDIRSFIVSFFFNDENFIALAKEFKIQSPNNKEIINLIIEKCRKYQIIISDFVVRNLTLHILLALERIKSDFIIEDVSVVNFDHNIVYTANEIAEVLEQMTNLVIPQSEIHNICLHLSNKAKVNKINDAESNQRLKDAILEFEKHFFLNFLALEYRDYNLEKDLYNHCFYLLNRLSNKVNLKNPLLDDIKTKYSVVFDQVRDSIKENSLFGKEMIDEHEIAYIAIHVLASLEKIQFDRKCRVLVICSTGYGSSKLLQNRLLKYFDKQIEIKAVLGAYDLNDNILSNVDFIISTIPIEHIDVKIPIIITSVFLHESEKEEISREIAIVNQNNFSHSEHLLFVDQILNEKLFLIVDKPVTKNELLKVLVNKLYQQEYVLSEKAFYQNVMLRESFSSTAFSDDVAMPHPQSFGADDGLVKSTIAIAIIKDGVKWDDYFNQIRLVFLYVPIQNEGGMLKIMTNFLIDLIDNQDSIQKLISCSSFDEFKMSLKRMLLEDKWKKRNSM